MNVNNGLTVDHLAVAWMRILVVIGYFNRLASRERSNNSDKVFSCIAHGFHCVSKLGLSGFLLREDLLIANGFHSSDLLAEDRYLRCVFDLSSLLAQLELQTDDYRWVTEQLLDVASECCDGRVVSLLEGGYDLKALRESVQVHVSSLLAA